MRWCKGIRGFTIVEMIFALSLLSAFGIGSGLYISNSFKESNYLASKTEIQNSVNALMNKLETTIKTADIPVLTIISDKEFEINQVKNAAKVPVKFVFDEDKQIVTEASGTEYNYIQDIDIQKVGDNGAQITIIGQNEKYELTSTYYSRNTVSALVAGCVHSGSWEYDDYEHWQNCNNCNSSIEPIESHIFDTNNECIKCGYIHVHSWNLDSKVESTCTTKGKEVYKCVCGAIDEKELGLKAHTAGTWKYDTNNHWKLCTVCNGYAYSKEVHTFDTSNQCTKCGYQNNSMPKCEHEIEWLIDGGKHCQACIICGVEVTEYEDHIYAWGILGNTHEKDCIVCGYTTAIGEHQYAWAINGSTHEGSCTICGYTKEKGEHEYKWEVDGNVHKWSCTVCGYTKETGEHTYGWEIGDSTHKGSCTICGATKSEDNHTYSFEVTANTHKKTCTVCGYSRRTENHIYSWEIDGNLHKKTCISCGYTTEVEKHIYEWEIDSNNHKGICRRCGHEQYGKHEMEWEIDSNNHKGICSMCGYEQSSTHKYENGICIICGHE